MAQSFCIFSQTITVTLTCEGEANSRNGAEATGCWISVQCFRRNGKKARINQEKGINDILVWTRGGKK